MIEKIEKLASLNQEVVELLKLEKLDEAVVKLAEVQELTKEMVESSMEVPVVIQEQPTEEVNKEAIEKEQETAKAIETLHKFVSLNISAESIKELIDGFGELKDQMTAGIDTINKRLDTVEQAKNISKQADEKIEKTSQNVWGDLAILG